MEEITAECWLPVVGYEGLYEVSDQGRTRSLDRFEQITGPKAGVRHRRGREIRQFPIQASPYLFVRLSRDSKGATLTVHSLVLTAFKGPRPEGMEARHLNGQSRDNRAENLAWGTRSENTLDQVAHGTHRNSRKTRCSRGHEFDYTIPGTNRRQCLKCRRINQAAHKQPSS